MPGKYFKLIRPKQWIKNFFVFAPILFAGQLTNKELLFKNIIAFIAFCFISSSVYIINDIIDVESDRIHKKKRYRPIASGDIKIKNAIFLFCVTFVLAGAVAYFTNLYFIIVIAVYFIINLLYSFKVKHIVILDVFFISLGFMLRVAGGAFAIDVTFSSWMILTTIFLSLFLGISKRRAELATAEEDEAEKQRKVLNHYIVEFSDQMNTIAATGTIICYALYTVSQKAVSTFHTENLIYTTPFVIYGIFRYLYLLHRKNLGESPTMILMKDIPLIINIIIWFIASVLIIYKPKLLP